jgi:flagellin-like protein
MTTRKGISPVIATVIIVAVTIAVAIAVAFWMTGIIGLFTGSVEKLEIISLYAQPNKDQSGWTVNMMVRNTGTTTTSIDEIFINNVPSSQWGTDNKVDPTPSITVNPGGNATLTITLKKGSQIGTTTLNPGVSIEVKLHTTGGREYPKLTNLP